MAKAVILGNSNLPHWESPVTIHLEYSLCSAISYRGVGYKDINEDRVIVIPNKNTMIVADGMGGPGEGYKAAQILCDILMALPEFESSPILAALEDASSRIRQECKKSSAGVCYLIAKLDYPTLHIWYAGDVKLLILNHGIRFETQDHTLINTWIQNGDISPDDAIHHPMRHIVTRALSGDGHEMDYCQTTLEPNDRIIIASDGLWDNFTPIEVDNYVVGISPFSAVELLLQKSTYKMRQVYSDQWEGLLAPKPDNISILITDILVHPKQNYQPAH
ncbi:MAG: SpoIIE family protein phosphatase [SAR324 cluster bacterium]|nr:SpoIIE family protein phosphatase [SAR324 cluster bacterium]